MDGGGWIGVDLPPPTPFRPKRTLLRECLQAASATTRNSQRILADFLVQLEAVDDIVVQ